MSIQFEKLNILVVEDTEPMRKLVISVLETLGVRTIYSANDGEAGYRRFCDKKPDIVLADWHMGDSSGIDLLKKIRHDPASPNKTVPVVIMTGYSALQRVEMARDTGATEFLVKPFSADGLAKRIAHVINKPRDFVKVPESYFGPDRRRRKSDNYNGPKRRNSDG